MSNTPTGLRAVVSSQERLSRSSARVRWLRLCFCVLGLTLAPLMSAAQPPPPPDELPLPVKLPDGPPATVRGVVLNAATGQPLPRALVQVGEDLGALTDAQGRFEIPGVPSGVWMFSAVKPGFQDRAGISDDVLHSPHFVRVAAEMPEVSLSLYPKNSLYGRVTLSTGVPALGIGLTLFRQTIVDGRAAWSNAGQHITTPDGSFRYTGLSDGTYLLTTQPEFDNEHAGEPACGPQAPKDMNGFAMEFYKGAREVAGASPIVLAGGRSAEVNLTLNLTRFHLVEAAVAHAPAKGSWTFTHQLLGPDGQPVAYPVHEEKDHSLCAYLPDGSYQLIVQAEADREEQLQAVVASGTDTTPAALAGFLPFGVDGQAVTGLRVPLARGATTPIYVRFQPGPPNPLVAHKRPEGYGPEGREEMEFPTITLLELSATRVNSVEDVRLGSTPINDTTFRFDTASPGQYWMHATSRSGTCVGTVTSGSQSLAALPWTVGSTGQGAPIDVVLRTDCARLTVQMPPALAAERPGQGAAWYVYVVPQFDSIAGIATSELDQFDDRSEKLSDLTPGPYRVYAFPAPRSVEFHDPAALAPWGPGQSVTLEPGADVTLVLEGSSR